MTLFEFWIFMVFFHLILGLAKKERSWDLVERLACAPMIGLALWIILMTLMGKPIEII